MSHRTVPAAVVVLSLVMSLFLSSCGSDYGAAGSAVPKRRAYPRIEPYPEEYVAVPGIPVSFEVNSSAVLKSGQSDARLFDVCYERFGAVLHCTFTPASGHRLRSVLDNRTERISLNLGDNSAELTEIVSHQGGVYASVLTAPSAEVTPIQFLATDSASFVLSGALVLGRAGTPDSIRPILQSVERDIIHGLVNMRR